MNGGAGYDVNRWLEEIFRKLDQIHAETQWLRHDLNERVREMRAELDDMKWSAKGIRDFLWPGSILAAMMWLGTVFVITFLATNR